MSTVTMNISMSNTLRDYVDAQVKARGYTSASEYMRELVRREEERGAHERFYASIQEGMASPVLGEWSDLRKAFFARTPPSSNLHRDAQRT